MTWTLKRTKQCNQCPWRIDVNPNDIPDGYCETKHQGLSRTIAKEGDLSTLSSKEIYVMACHETDNAYCIGWLMNQLGRGNNIPMRIKMISCSNRQHIKLVGKQHSRFIDTLPK
jgi:uncharacterized Fe-S radical SAM superfamily protein PflX